MKKYYNQPQTTSIEYTMQQTLCASETSVVNSGTPIGGGDDPANGI